METQTKDSEIISGKWSLVSVYKSVFEVEIGKQYAISALNKEELIDSLIELISSESVVEHKDWMKKVFKFLFTTKRINGCGDCRISPYFGPNTKRITYSADRHHVFYESPAIKYGRQKIKALGKRTEIRGIPVRASVELVIVSKAWTDGQVTDAQSEKLDWFCGVLDE